MIKRFILFLLLLVAGAASAGTEVVWYHYNYPADTYSTSASGACSAGVSKHYAGNTFTGASMVAPDKASCNCSHYAYPGGPIQYGTCGQAVSTVVTECPYPEVRQANGGCGAPPCDTPSGQTVKWATQQGHSTKPGATKPDSGSWSGGLPNQADRCGIVGGKPDTVERCYSSPASDGGTDFWCDYTGRSNGEKAVPSNSPQPQPPNGESTKPVDMPPASSGANHTCPTGSVQGGVDSGGVPICVGSGTRPSGENGAGASSDARPTSKTTTKTVDGSGNEVTTITEKRKNSDGSETVRKTIETVAPDGSKSSTTDEKTGLTPGTDPKQGQPDKPDDDFCRQHPDLNVCRNSSIAGTCGQITCMGDAIQCATLREAATMECRQKQAEDELKASGQYSLGTLAAAGNDPEKGSFPSASNASVVDVPALNANGWLGGGAGFADVSFTVQGQTITIPFSKAMPYLLALRYALMVVASLMSFRILSGAILGS